MRKSEEQNSGLEEPREQDPEREYVPGSFSSLSPK